MCVRACVRACARALFVLFLPPPPLLLLLLLCVVFNEPQSSFLGDETDPVCWFGCVHKMWEGKEKTCLKSLQSSVRLVQVPSGFVFYSCWC